MTYGGNAFHWLTTQMVKKFCPNPFSAICFVSEDLWNCAVVNTFLLGSCRFLSYLLSSFSRSNAMLV